MVSIRLAAPEDFEFFYQLKCEPSNIFWTGFDTPPERTSFQKWYERIIQNQGEKTNRKIYIIMDDNTPVGHIYIHQVLMFLIFRWLFRKNTGDMVMGRRRHAWR